MARNEALKQEALAKIEKEQGKPDSPTAEIGLFLIVWVGQDETAAEKVMKEKKTISGAYAAMRNWASNHKSGNAACVSPMDAGVIILKYYGCKEPESVLESGLMYAVMMARAEQLKPYGMAAEKSAPLSKQEKPQSKPAKPQAIAKEKPKTGGLSLGLDDLLGM